MKVKKVTAVFPITTKLIEEGTEKTNPTMHEFYNHLANGHPILYAGKHYLNDVEGKQLIAPDKKNPILYALKNDLSVVLQKNRMGSIGTLKYELSQIVLVFYVTII